MTDPGAPSRWLELASGMGRLASCEGRLVEEWQLERLTAVLAHHCEANGPYRALLKRSGIPDGWTPNALRDIERLPTTDKGFLRSARFDLHPATKAAVTIVSTSGTTSTAAAIPHNEASLRTGLGDNFGRAFIGAGIGLPLRPWLIGHWDPSNQIDVGITGSFLSMAWLTALLDGRTLFHNSLVPFVESVRAAAAFRPGVVASSPNLLASLARAIKAEGIDLEIPTLLYGGAAATADQRGLWRDAFHHGRTIAFYPTTDAGAIGSSSHDDGSYATFTETHFVEVLDEDGNRVQPGERGQLAVTAYRSLAAPLIRYRVGDLVTFEGRDANRVQVSTIERASFEATIGDALVPLALIDEWAADLRRAGHTVAAVQLACRTDALGRDLPVLRLLGATDGPNLRRAATALVLSAPQLAYEVREGSVAEPQVEFIDQPATDASFKLHNFVDERSTPNQR